VRIHLVSDLHDDIDGNAIAALPEVEADVTVVAGDAMAPGHLAIRRVRELFPDRDRPLIYVPGNHDFYSFHEKHRPELKTTIEAQRRDLMPRAAEEAGVLLGDDATFEIGGVIFICATLWSDMRCSPDYMQRADVMREAAKRMNDYKVIKTGEGRSKDRLTPADTIAMHKESVAYIEARLEAHVGRDVVVVTHHAPSPRSLRRYVSGSFGDLDWCYASDLEHLMTGDAAPALWLHGHIHEKRDYVVGDTRVVANPRGYPPALGSRVRENPHFDPGLVIDLEPRYMPKMGI
jgi:Icc-related predicted phosphoesterase